VLGSFVVLGRELEEGSELPFAFEEHVQRGGPALYELRPLVRSFIEQREPVLRAREDARIAVDELRREPAAAIFARAHAGPGSSEDEALFRTVLLGLLISTAEACGGIDLDDESFERAYALLESSLYGEHRRYVAIARLRPMSRSKYDCGRPPDSNVVRKRAGIALAGGARLLPRVSVGAGSSCVLEHARISTRAMHLDAAGDRRCGQRFG
jgi:hypothetical protein